MTGLIPKGTIFDTDLATASDAFASDLSMSEGRSTVRVTVCLDTKSKLRAMVDDGSVSIGMVLNNDADLEADTLYTFCFGFDSNYTLNFRHTDAGTVRVNMLLVDEVTGGLI